MELRHLRSFVVLAEELHFGRAAKRLHMAQPPLSQQIQRLERELGVTLFDRDRHGVELTAAGSLLLGQVRLTLAQAERTVRMAGAAASGLIGEVRVGFTGSLLYSGLPRVLRCFREATPGVRVTMEQMRVPEQLEALRGHRLDVCLIRPAIEPLDGLAVEVIGSEPLMAILPEGHPAAAFDLVPLADLADEDFIGFPGPFGPTFPDYIAAACVREGFVPRFAERAALIQTIIGWVAAGLGVSLIPAGAARAVTMDGAVIRPLAEPTPTIDYALVWLPDRVSPSLRGFLDVTRSGLRSPL